MKQRVKYIVRVFLILFTLSVSVPVMSGGFVPVHGLFGEVKAWAVTEESPEETAEIGKAAARRSGVVKQADRYNEWFRLAIIIICLSYAACEMRLPRKDTMVDLKVRMNN